METKTTKTTDKTPVLAVGVNAIVSPWVSANDNLPPQCRKVLVAYKNQLGNGRIVLAERYEPLTVECNCEYDCDCDYDEKRDCYYMPKGWWEVAENHDEFQLMLIAEKITHWMYLPKCP